ncbi:hypothetical protein LguiB_005487 [Lonicera macranthoides]
MSSLLLYESGHLLTAVTVPICTSPSYIFFLMGDETPVYTLDEALSTIGFGKFQGLVLAYAGLGWVAEAMEMMLLSFVGPALETEWGLSSAEESMISTVVFAGMLLGAYAWGLVSDTFGRRSANMISPYCGAHHCDYSKRSFTKHTAALLQRPFDRNIENQNPKMAILCSGAGFLSAFSPNYISLVTLRGLLGIGLGSGHVLISWFLEFVPTPNRGTWMVIFSGFWTVGAIFEASLAWTSLNPKGNIYDVLSFRTIIINVFHYWKKLPHGILVSDDHITELNEDYASLEDTHLISLIEKKPKNSSMVTIFSSKLIKTTLLLWFLYFGNMFSYYGIILLTSELSSDQSKCSSSTTLPLGNTKDASLYIDVFITSLAEVPGLVLSGIIVDRVGRKLSMEIMFILGFILLLPLVTAQHEILTTASLFGARMFISATFTVACIYAPEVYPTSIRATGVGIATAMGTIGGMVCPVVAVPLVSGCHQTAAVIVFEVVIFLSGLSVIFFPLETKGRELTDSVDLLC